MQDTAAILEEILGEADALIRQRLKDRGLELPHLVIAVTPDGQVVLRSNVSADVLRSFGEDLKNVADETRRTAEAGRHDALNGPPWCPSLNQDARRHPRGGMMSEPL
jgi:hypothetical protein